MILSARAKHPQDELSAFRERSAAQFVEAVGKVLLSIVAPPRGGKYSALESLADLIGQTMALADLFGRRRVLLQADALRSNPGSHARPIARFAEIDEIDDYGITWITPIVPRVDFPEAVDDLLDREPRLAEGWREVAKAYSMHHVFALAKSAEIALTKRVQKTLSDLLKAGKPSDVKSVIAEMGDWTKAYAENVYRTNLATAYTAGQFRQLQDPAISSVIPAIEFVATRDASVRPNHLAADGLIAKPNHPVWDRFTPPLGYQCRCVTILADAFDLERRGLLDKVERGPVYPKTFSMAHPDEGFGGGRPDRRIYSRR